MVSIKVNGTRYCFTVLPSQQTIPFWKSVTRQIIFSLKSGTFLCLTPVETKCYPFLLITLIIETSYIKWVKLFLNSCVKRNIWVLATLMYVCVLTPVQPLTLDISVSKGAKMAPVTSRMNTPSTIFSKKKCVHTQVVNGFRKEQ